jgi:hypothetical protein
MIQVYADILLIDEVLAVGDAAFQQKCFDVFNEMRDEGRTILFVTHDMGAVERFCHRAMLLERGEIVAIGEPHEVAASYLELNFSRPIDGTTSDGTAPRGGDGRARVLEAWMEDARGERKGALRQGESCVFRARVRFNEDVEDPSFDVAFVNEHRLNQFVASTRLENERTGRFAAGEEVTWSVAFDNVLGPGRYMLSTALAHRGGGTDLLDRFERIASFVVISTATGGGLVDLPSRISLERETTQQPHPVDAPL